MTTIKGANDSDQTGPRAATAALNDRATGLLGALRMIEQDQERRRVVVGGREGEWRRWGARGCLDTPL